jgi:hypothetical protein
MPGDNAKKRENVRAPLLEWQSELDASMAAIDTRLVHPRRRATDAGPQPQLPGLGDVHLTTELLDEIAWRVSEQMRRHALAFPLAAAEAAPAPPPAKDAGLRPGKMIMIRYRMPLLPWPFRLLQRRRKKKLHPLTTAKAPA